MDKVKIEVRIRDLAIEREKLKNEHTEMVQRNQLINQEFQQLVIKNQTRYAQLTGAIDELRHMTNGQTPSADNPTQETPTP